LNLFHRHRTLNTAAHHSLELQMLAVVFLLIFVHYELRLGLGNIASAWRVVGD
jgi:hypothetical protein